jgi:hypothetical protein
MDRNEPTPEQKMIFGVIDSLITKAKMETFEKTRALREVEAADYEDVKQDIIELVIVTEWLEEKLEAAKKGGV